MIRWSSAEIEQITEYELVMRALRDPCLLEALREVDAMTPAVPPFLPPDRDYPFERLIPESWSYDHATATVVSPNGVCFSRASIELHGWEWAKIYAKKDMPP